MATRASASAVINVPVEKVWSEIRNFTFPEKLLEPVASVVLEDGAAPTQVGAVRLIKWKSGDSRRQRLLELSDIERKAAWETIESQPEAEVSATLTTVTAKRITENNATLLTWESEFSADVSGELIVFEQKSYQKNLEEIKKALGHHH